MIITVFTPSYNREKFLPKLYSSLLRQTFKDFEWVIVDDGSSDNTTELVNRWKEEGFIKIKYFKKNNGGKHRAINKGLELASGELFFIVDSDDYLTDNALEIVCKYYEPIKNNDNIIGVTGFRAYSDGSFIGGRRFPNEITDSNLIERRTKYGVTADLAHVIKTHIFRKFLFPDISGENFVAESIVWNRMSIDYKMRYFNEAIYIGEYLEEGLSSNSIRNRIKNNKYASLLYSELVNNPNVVFKLKVKSIINYWRFALCNDKSIFENLKFVKNYFLAILLFPIGYVYYLKDKKYNDVKINR
ncbi:glycosyltransferase family 2 protein [Empedobacter tilapiae]|uniref:Glycosyltransferase family 2 protein n=1 Tax=Empedobacter tilapiae TaxID=2491114 RepID=A0A4Z1B6H6_9FLAO|nr:glycosyltransferase family 2 protein [Empedobacter tilapiae]TGN26696.1 glycosyltransferase family 2 protein [Empedobacter tilapiae]